MGNDLTMGYTQCCGNTASGYYDQINTIRRTDITKTKTMIKIDQQIDTFTTKMLDKKIHELLTEILGGYPSITFPAPFPIHFDEKENSIQTIAISCLSNMNSIDPPLRFLYKLPLIDEYYGDLNYVHRYDNINKYDKITDLSLPIHKAFDSIDEAKQWFDDAIHRPLYGPNDDDEKAATKKLINSWRGKLDTDNIAALLDSDEVSGDSSDRWLTMMAFMGFAAHRTMPLEESEEHPGCYYVSDVSFLSAYDVRKGYDKYGAIAYFDAKYRVVKIYVCHSEKTYTPNSYVKDEWNHAKWVWKVSVTVAVFLVDMMCHCRFREASGLIQAMQKTLPADHPIRRLLLPFTIGTVYANRVFNEYLKQNALFHRAFAFSYDGLAKLVRDSMSDDSYKFRLIIKKTVALKRLPSEIFPMNDALQKYWFSTLEFVNKYMSVYYGEDDADDSKLLNDWQIAQFYGALRQNLNIDERYRLKKFNVINILANAICNATIWHSHLSGSVSFEYNSDPGFTGLKIDQGSDTNSIQNYVEYCIVAMTKGWKCEKGFPWKDVLLNDEHISKTREICKAYFEDGLAGIIRQSEETNGKIVPYNGMNPKYFNSSIML